MESFAALDGMNFSDLADQQIFAEAYAARLKEAGIEIAAITDYNGVREPWFRLIREAAARHGVIVLPGVELSVAEGKNGSHILVVFAETTDPKEINEYLRALDRTPARDLFTGRTHRDIELRDPLPVALKELRARFDCLLIPAHADESKGIVQSLGAENAAAVIVEADLDGLDHAGGAMHKIRSTKVKGRWQHLALIEFSDPRSIADIGGKASSSGGVRETWLKLSSTEIDAMRLALHDPETRVTTTAPAPASNGRIISVAVEGTGFLGNVTLMLDANLNNFIGGRGTGKSALLESMRYCLAIAPFCDEDKREELVKHALGAGGKVSLEVERQSDSGPAKRYRISRVYGESPTVTDAETGEVVGLAPKETFGPDHEPIILLQREIDKISSDSTYRRDLLDRLIGDEVHQAEKAVDEARRVLRQNGHDIGKHLSEQAKRPDLVHELTKIEHELKIYEDNGVLEKLSRHSHLRQTRQKLVAARDLAGALRSDGAEWRQALQAAASEVDEHRAGLVSQEEELTLAAGQALANAVSALSAAETQAIIALEAAEREMGALVGRHDQTVAPLADDLNRIKQELHADKLDADRVLSLSARCGPLKTKVEALDRKLPAIEALRSKRAGLLANVAGERERESRVRLKVAESINKRLSSRVEVVVIAHGDVTQFAEDFRTLLQGSGVNGVTIEGIAQSATDGASIADAVRSGAADLVERFGITTTQAGKICTWFADESNGRLAELEMLAPRDKVDLRLHVDGETKTIDNASAGQRATAILMLIFAVDDRCMLLDQPEDDLDNRFIFDDVVQMIRSQKATIPGSTRQITAATHNPNIPVLGDAELVVVLDASGSEMIVAAQGSIDAYEIRKHIRQVLEGGEEALFRRYQKYGGVRTVQMEQQHQWTQLSQPLIGRQLAETSELAS
ncbi:MAG TPA: hypothetical protein DGG94_15675 [Micromonosporaceae bacterium]|nr:hypothetical protein [Micromonosporaceae bacterium]